MERTCLWLWTLLTSLPPVLGVSGKKGLPCGAPAEIWSEELSRQHGIWLGLPSSVEWGQGLTQASCLLIQTPRAGGPPKGRGKGPLWSLSLLVPFLSFILSSLLKKLL